MNYRFKWFSILLLLIPLRKRMAWRMIVKCKFRFFSSAITSWLNIIIFIIQCIYETIKKIFFNVMLLLVMIIFINLQLFVDQLHPVQQQFESENSFWGIYLLNFRFLHRISACNDNNTEFLWKSIVCKPLLLHHNPLQ